MPLPAPGQPTTASTAKGTTLSYQPSIEYGGWQAVAEIVDIKMPKVVAETIEVKRYDSSSVFPENIGGGWANPGELEFTVVYEYDASLAFFNLIGDAQAFKVTKPDTHGYEYNAILTEHSEELPLDKKYSTCVIKLKINGAPVPF